MRFFNWLFGIFGGTEEEGEGDDEEDDLEELDQKIDTILTDEGFPLMHYCEEVACRETETTSVMVRIGNGPRLPVKFCDEHWPQAQEILQSYYPNQVVKVWEK